MLVSSILIVWPEKECHMLHFGMLQYLKGIRFRAKTHMSHMLVQCTLYCYQETTCGLTNTALLTLQDDNNGALAITMALGKPDIMAKNFFVDNKTFTKVTLWLANLKASWASEEGDLPSEKLWTLHPMTKRCPT